MTKERWIALMRNDNPPDLTEEEIKEGWHFCDEMDGLLANSNEPDGDCYCSLSKQRCKSSTKPTKAQNERLTQREKDSHDP